MTTRWDHISVTASDQRTKANTSINISPNRSCFDCLRGEERATPTIIEMNVDEIGSCCSCGGSTRSGLSLSKVVTNDIPTPCNRKNYDIEDSSDDDNVDDKRLSPLLTPANLSQRLSPPSLGRKSVLGNRKSTLALSDNRGNDAWGVASPKAMTSLVKVGKVPPSTAAFVTKEQLDTQFSQRQLLHRPPITGNNAMKNTGALKLAMARNNVNHQRLTSSEVLQTNQKQPSYNTAFRALVESDEEITKLLQMLRTTGEDRHVVGPKPINKKDKNASRGANIPNSLLDTPKNDATSKDNSLHPADQQTQQHPVNKTPPSCFNSHPIKSILLTSIYSSSEISSISQTSDAHLNNQFKLYSNSNNNNESRKKRRTEGDSGLALQRANNSSVQFKTPATIHVIDRTNSGWYTKEDKRRMEKEANSLSLLRPQSSSPQSGSCKRKRRF